MDSLPTVSAVPNLSAPGVPAEFHLALAAVGVFQGSAADIKLYLSTHYPDAKRAIAAYDFVVTRVPYIVAALQVAQWAMLR